MKNYSVRKLLYCTAALSVLTAGAALVAPQPTAKLVDTVLGTQTAYAATQQDAVNWINAQNGHWVGSGQCVALAQAYEQYLGVPVHHGNGNSFAQGVPAGWTVYQNTPTFLPQPGDIAVFTTLGYYGHVSLVTSANLNTFTSMDQNWYTDSDAGSAACYVTHSYKSSYGLYFVRPNFSAPAAPAAPPVYNPVSSLDIVQGQAGSVLVSGWAWDPDVPNSSLNVDVYIGGPAGDANAEGHRILANENRPDVANYVHSSGNFGFYNSIATNMRGNQPIYLYAINQGSGGNTEIGHGTVNISQSSAPIANGIYRIINTANGKAIDSETLGAANNTPVHLWDSQSTNPLQLFQVINQSDGSSEILALGSGRALEIGNAQTANNVPISQFDDNGSDTQRWYIRPANDASQGYVIYNKNSGKQIDNYGQGTANGNVIEQWGDNNGNPASQWSFVPASRTLSSQVTVTRNIKYVNSSGSAVHTPTVQKASFTKTTDLVTGAVTWSRTSASLAKVNVPVIKGYKANLSSLAATTVTPTSASSTVTVKYAVQYQAVSKNLTRTINYLYANGKTAKAAVKQSLNFLGIQNEVTGAIYWNQASQTFKAVSSPSIKNYLASTTSVAASKVTGNSKNSSVTVKYTEKTVPVSKVVTRTIKYVNSKNKVLKTITQKLTFTGNKGIVTGSIVWQQKNQTFPKVVSTLSDTTVNAKTVTPSSSNSSITITAN